jgi:hypothetical protein
VATCTLKETTGTEGSRGQDAVTLIYELSADSVILDPLEAITIARSASGSPVPARNAIWSSAFIFAQSFNAKRNEAHKKQWIIEVQFSPPPDGEDESHLEEENPLLRPAVYDIQYIEQEYVVEQARNVTELTGGFSRPVNTLAPIVNAAFRRPDEPVVDTERNGIVVIEKNYATLGAIMSLNETYQRTCNSDTVNVGGESIAARRLKYLVTRSGGKQVENGITFYPGVTEIEIKKSTDLTIDNVGFEYWDPAAGAFGDYVRAKDANEDPTAEPVNLNLDGTRNTSDPKTTITYRHLEEVAYTGFFS